MSWRALNPDLTVSWNDIHSFPVFVIQIFRNYLSCYKMQLGLQYMVFVWSKDSNFYKSR